MNLMRDYPAGAFEALSWVHTEIENALVRKEDPERILKDIINQIEGVLRKIKIGVAVDFTYRISSTV